MTPKQLTRRELRKICKIWQPGSYQQGETKKILNREINRSIIGVLAQGLPLKVWNVPRGTIVMLATDVRWRRSGLASA